MLEQEKAQGNLFFWTAISIIRMLLLSLRAFVAPVKETNYSSIVNKKLKECKLHVKLKNAYLRQLLATVRAELYVFVYYSSALWANSSNRLLWSTVRIV